MGFAYSATGMRAWNDPASLLPGEVYFAAAPTLAELQAAFPGYGTATLAEQAAVALSGTLSIALSGTLTLAATAFPIDAVTQQKLGAVVTTLVATGSFPGGGASYPMKDTAGTWHSLTATQYKAVAGAIAAYVAALVLIVDGNPTGATALPAASVALVVA